MKPDFKNLPTTLEGIKSMEIWGNAYHDMDIFKAVNQFVHNKDNSMKDKIEILEWSSREVMGMEETVTEEGVKKYIEAGEMPEM